MQAGVDRLSATWGTVQFNMTQKLKGIVQIVTR